MHFPIIHTYVHTYHKVREEQQHYMKEKRAFNIARRTWVESFKDREGRMPTDAESNADPFMVDLNLKIAHLDAIVAALHKRSMKLMKNAWNGGGGGAEGDAEGDAENAERDR